MKIYRSVEDPLFDCTEINVHILEYKKSSYFNWYKNNKENVNYGVLIYL